MLPLDELRDELSKERVLIVAGTGVSRQATGNEKCASWDGLILDAIRYCLDARLILDDEADALRKRLASEKIEVAEVVSKKLGRDLRRWLKKSVGALPLREPRIIDAVHSLRTSIATTNYDDLLSRGRGIEAVPWTKGHAAHEIIRDNRQGILHFHGYYDDPDSVILGTRSYQTLVESHGPQAIQQAIVATRTLLFIGCGDGLSDPNFGPLLEWMEKAFGGSIYRHYALGRRGEKQHPSLTYIEYGAGYDELAPFLERELARPLPPALASHVPNPGYCFGRDREIEEVVAALLDDKPQAVPILGGPGMGKTTLSLKALTDRRVAARFAERRWFVRLDGVKSRPELAAAIARALEIPITPTVEHAVIGALTEFPSAALVLDNAETPLDADGPEIEKLLATLALIESLALVVTIRSHKRPRGVPWGFSVEPQRLDADAARDVFVAVSGHKHFAKDPDLDRLLAVLDGVPIAITLMAQYAEVFNSLEPVWEAWKTKRTAMLKDGKQSIAVSYELSIGVLSAKARRLLSVLAILPDGVAARDLARVFGDPDDAAYELRQRALVFDEGKRLRMLAPLREYVVATYPPDAEDARRALDHYLALAGTEGNKVGEAGGADAVARLVPELANVEAALTRSDDVADDRLGEAVSGSSLFMRMSGLGLANVIETIANRALAKGRSNLAARCFKELGRIFTSRSEYEEGRRWFEQALEQYRQLGDRLNEAICLERLGAISIARSNFDEARRLFSEAQALFQQVRGLRGEASSLLGLGDVALKQLEYDVARDLYEKAMTLYRRAKSDHGVANATRNLGYVAMRIRDYKDARARAEAAMPIFQSVGDLVGEANCLCDLAGVFLEEGDRARARVYYAQALPKYKQIGSFMGQGNCHWGFAEIARVAGEQQKAATEYRKALEFYEAIPAPASIAVTHRKLAQFTDGAERDRHVAVARAAARRVNRDDLLKQLDDEFGPEK